MNNNHIGIIGYGRFGPIMQCLLEPEHKVFFYDTNTTLHREVKFKPLTEIVQLPTLVLAVPIGQIERTLQKIASQLQAKTIIDVCSVKQHPTQLMLKYLPAETQIITMHPMFGPDSYNSNQQQNMMMYPVRARAELFQQWQEYFRGKHIHISVMTPKQHDQDIALSQNLTHLIGRILGELTLQDSAIATTGYRSLQKIVEQTCNDSWELFADMMQYNRYSRKMLAQLVDASDKIITKLKLSNGENTYGE